MTPSAAADMDGARNAGRATKAAAVRQDEPLPTLLPPVIVKERPDGLLCRNRIGFRDCETRRKAFRLRDPPVAVPAAGPPGRRSGCGASR